RVLANYRDQNGKQVLYLTVQFKILHTTDSTPATDINRDEIIVEEDRKRVADLEIYQPKANKLTAVVAMDISGSMKGQSQTSGRSKMDEARGAARLFLDQHLDARADLGLILFDHEMRVTEAPVGSAAQLADHRKKLRQIIDDAKPLGGTAYLDATVEAVKMLKGIDGRRAVLLMTDGVDLSSTNTLQQAIDAAKAAEVPV